ncbi:hypothetical protein CHUAL_003642 [Chamberlinius hualienensis]
MGRLNFSILLLMLLTGLNKVSANGTTTASITNNSNSDSSNENNKTVKRSFDFPTIFYPGPDNRFITMAPMPKLPITILESTIHKNKLDEELISHQLIVLAPNTTTRPDVNLQKKAFPAEKLNSLPAESFNDFVAPAQHREQIRHDRRRPRPTHDRRVNIHTGGQHFTDASPSHHQAAAIKFIPLPTTFRPINPFIQERPNKESQLSAFAARTNRNQRRRKPFIPAKFESQIPRQPFKKIPNHREFNVGQPQNGFHCPVNQMGYFADVQSACQKFYVCHNNRRFTFKCPSGTRFSQSHLVCDWERRVKCS